MEFRILGPLEVVAEGRQLPLRRAKQRALLAVLLLHANETVSSDELIDELWGEAPPATAPKALQGHVSALRKLLGAARIETREGGYLLRQEPGELDAEAFQTAVADARMVEDAAERSRKLLAALELWRGEPLADFRYDEFARAEIARLDELRLATLEERIEAELETGDDPELLLPELEQLVSAHPLRERLRAQRMLALYRAGRQAEALHVYQQGRRLLAEELGIDPGSALQTLERQILAQDPTLDPPKRAKPVPPRQERKRVTVLVAEFSGPSDPEELGRLLEPTLVHAQAIIAGFGASVKPLFANALIGIFGAPRTHEDDPDRAVRAAAALVEATRDHDRLTVRIGVEQGDALVTIEGDEIDVTGEVAAAAARLQGTAPAGGVALGDSVRQLTGRGRDRRDVPFLGREDEVALLKRTYDRAVRESSVQLMTIAGEPGSGKTRLAQELRSVVVSRGWLEGRCLPYGDGVTFWALGEIVKEYAGILESDDVEASKQRLSGATAALLPESDERRWVEESLAPLVGLAPVSGTPHERLFAAWRRFLEAIAERQPLVVLLEDLQWADSALIEFIDELVDRAVSVPLLVLCTARLDVFDRHPHWGGGKRNATTVTLPPLSLEETRALARALLGGEEPSDALVARASGNPLFAQELARVETEPGDSLPESLQAVIAARLDSLAPEVKQAAMDAAVVGEVFWSGAVAAIGGLDESEAEERLYRLAAADVARATRASSVRGQSEYAFLHALVRDAAYNEIPRAQRARKHEAVAAWIQKLAGGRVVDHAELIAHHYAAALEYAVTGDAELTIADAARLALRQAGDRAFSLNAFPAAVRYYAQAFDLWPRDDPDRPELLFSLAHARYLAGDELREHTLEQARDALLAIGRRDRAAEAEGLLAVVWWFRGHRDRADTHVRRASERVQDLPPSRAKADVLVRVAHMRMLAGAYEEAVALGEEALAMVDSLELDELRPRALLALGSAKAFLGDLRGGIADLERSAEIALRLRSPTAAIAFNNLGAALWWMAGDVRQAKRFIDDSVRVGDELGVEGAVSIAHGTQITNLAKTGAWEDGLRRADEYIAACDAGEARRGENAVRRSRARIRLARDDVAGALEDLERALEVARRAKDPQTLVPALGVAARVLVEVGRDDDARALGRELLETPHIAREPTLVEFAWVATELGFGSAVRELLDQVRAPTRWTRASRALLAGDYVAAADLFYEIGVLDDEAEARLRAAEQLVADGRRAEADEQLDKALAFFNSVAATRYLREAEALRGASAPATAST